MWTQLWTRGQGERLRAQPAAPTCPSRGWVTAAGGLCAWQTSPAGPLVLCLCAEAWTGRGREAHAHCPELCGDSRVPALNGRNVLAPAQRPQLFTAQIPLRQPGFVEISCCGRKRPIAQLKSPGKPVSASASSKPYTQNREFIAVSSFNYCFRVLLLPKSVIVSLARSERHPPETQGR